MLDRLMFANGVALGPGDEYVLVNETLAARITRYWLRGPKAGQSDVFASALPGYPDNLTYIGLGVFWVALPGPRNSALEVLAGWPWLRKVVQRMPAQLREQKLGRVAWVLAFNTDGQVIHDLQGSLGKLRAGDQRNGDERPAVLWQYRYDGRRMGADAVDPSDARARRDAGGAHLPQADFRPITPTKEDIWLKFGIA